MAQGSKIEILDNYPHDPAAFTQGLIFLDDHLYEGTGLYGRSQLRKVEPESGRVVSTVKLPSRYFGEGIALLNGKIYQLTWRSRIGFIYDAKTLERIGTFHYPSEGWGLTTDGNHLILSDGSDKLYFIRPSDFKRIKTLRVHDQKRSYKGLNELEFVGNEIYANVWKHNQILRISASTGAVLERIDFSALVDSVELTNPDAVLNGIAYDQANRDFYITGKFWPRVFRLKIIPAGGS